MSASKMYAFPRRGREETSDIPANEAVPQNAVMDDDELLESLRLLDNSQGLIRTIFLGLALQYRALDLQRRQLLCAAEDAPWEGMEPISVQTAASLITLCALFGFQRQAEDLAHQEALAGGCPDLTDVKLGATIILISLIRLIRLQSSARAGSQASQPGLEDQLEEELSDAEDF